MTCYINHWEYLNEAGSKAAGTYWFEEAGERGVTSPDEAYGALLHDGEQQPNQKSRSE